MMPLVPLGCFILDAAAKCIKSAKNRSGNAGKTIFCRLAHSANRGQISGIHNRSTKAIGKPQVDESLRHQLSPVEHRLLVHAVLTSDYTMPIEP